MSDIVERLRARSFRLATSDFNAHGAKLAFEAADEIEKLRKALSGLNAAIDAFWNDKTRPSIAHMNDQTLLKVEAAQRAARAAMGESDE